MRISKYIVFAMVLCLIGWAGLFLDRLFLLQDPNTIIKLVSKLVYIPHICTLLLALKIYKKASPTNQKTLLWFVITNAGLFLNDISWYFVAYLHFNMLHVSLGLFLFNLVPFFVWIVAIIVFLSRILNNYVLQLKRCIKTLVALIVINCIIVILFLSSIHYAAEPLSLSTISQISTFIAQIIVFDFVIMCLIYAENIGLLFFLSGVIVLISGDFFIIYSIISQTSILYSYGSLLWFLGLIFNLFGVLIIKNSKPKLCKKLAKMLYFDRNRITNTLILLIFYLGKCFVVP